MLHFTLLLMPLCQVKYHRPTNKFRGFIFDMVMSDAGEYAMFAVIMCNAVVLMLVHYGQSERCVRLMLHCASASNQRVDHGS
jgi:hypothetical protein